MEKEQIILSLDVIKPYEKNARKNDDAVPAVMESIRQCGYVQNIVVDENNVILAGHTRWKALKKLSIEMPEYQEIKVTQVTGLTDEQKRKYRLLDNKTSELALWDYDLLPEELDGLDFGDLWHLFDEKIDVLDVDIKESTPSVDMSKNNEFSCTCPNCGFNFIPIKEDIWVILEYPIWEAKTEYVAR